MLETLLDIDAQLMAAIVAALVSLIVSIPAVVLSIFRYRNENYLARRAEKAVRQLLKTYGPFVPFRLIAHHVGGFSANDLRQVLVRSGALRFADQNMVEHWALLTKLTREQQRNMLALTAPTTSTAPQHALFSADIEVK